MEKFKPEIVEILENEIVSRYYYQKGRAENLFKHDEDIFKAIEVLTDQTTEPKFLYIHHGWQQ